MLKRLLPLLLLCTCACFAQDRVIDCSVNTAGACTNHATLPAPVLAKKDHNFFLNKWNTPLLSGGAAGAFFMARELNGNRSNFTDLGFWHRHLPEAYRESLATMAAGDFVAYGFHKAHFRGHSLVERGALVATDAALIVIGLRQRRAYNQSDCDFGLKQFCR